MNDRRATYQELLGTMSMLALLTTMQLKADCVCELIADGTDNPLVSNSWSWKKSLDLSQSDLVDVAKEYLKRMGE